MDRRDRRRLVLVLGSLVAIGPLTIDMYLPALPSITSGLETTETAVQLTLTGTLIGLALGQLVIGPLSDAYGRRAPLLAGVTLHVVASILCAIAPNIAMLGTLRVLQGVGIATASVASLAVLRDLFTGRAFASIFSQLMLVMGAAPILAPTLGGVVLRWVDWRGVFLVLALLGVLLLGVAARWLPETLPPERRRPAGVRATVRGYGQLTRDRVFVGAVLVAGLCMGALFGYVAGSSFVMQEEFGLSEQEFAVAFGAGAVGLIGASQVNVRLLRRYSPQRILVAALSGGAASGAVMLAFAATGVGGLGTVLASLWLVLTFTGLALPNAPAVAMSRHGEAAGTAAALLGAIQFGLGAVTAPMVGVLGNGGVAMSVVILGCLTGATAVLLAVVRPARLDAADAATVPVAAH